MPLPLSSRNSFSLLQYFLKENTYPLTLKPETVKSNFNISTIDIKVSRSDIRYYCIDSIMTPSELMAKISQFSI